jgi:hypothetical protein
VEPGPLNQHAMELATSGPGVRVEDYLAAVASACGESVLVTAGFDIEGHDLTPGSGVFGDAANVVLTGDTVEVSEASATSVVGLLRDEGIEIPDLHELYAHVAATVGQARWGDVVTRVPAEHVHGVLPLQMAYELRPTVQRLAGPPTHVVTARALVAALQQVEGALDPAVARTIVFDVTFGMAKMAPMTKQAMDEVVSRGDA